MQTSNDPEPSRPVKLLKARMRHSRVFIFVVAAMVIVSGTQLSGDLLSAKIMEWSGYALVIFGVFIRIYSSLFIGGRKNDELITDGPFSIVRNPLYVGSFIAVLGIGMQSTSLFVLALLMVSFLLYYPFVIRREEAFLTQRFGNAYENYVSATPRVIPDIKLWRAPQELNCKPYNVLRTMLDGLVFFAALPLLDIVMALHANGKLPMWWVLP